MPITSSLMVLLLSAIVALSLVSEPAGYFGVDVGRVATMVTGDTLLRKGPPWCLAGLDPATASRIVGHLRGIASGSEADDRELRDSLGYLPQVSSSQVTPVHDEATCRKASRTLDATVFVTAQQAAVHLTKVGTWYAIVAPGARLGEFTPVVWTDSRWTRKATMEF